MCIYILIFFIKNGLSKINKRLATKKPSDTEREGESARLKVQIHPQFHLFGANPYAHRSK